MVPPVIHGKACIMYCDHLYAANHKEHLPSVAVDDEGGEHEGAQVHRTEYDGAHQSGVAPESDDLEHQRRKEREHDDADELEEHGHGQARTGPGAVGTRSRPRRPWLCP